MADIIVSSDVDTFMQSANQSAMRTNVGSGTIVTQNSNNVSITGGSITGITDLAVADGGTGSSTASGARTNLEVYGDAEVNAKVATKAVAGGVYANGGKVQGSIFSGAVAFSVNLKTGAISSGSQLYAGLGGTIANFQPRLVIGANGSSANLGVFYTNDSGNAYNKTYNGLNESYEFRHFTVVDTGSDIELYIDGTLIFASSVTGTYASGGATFTKYSIAGYHDDAANLDVFTECEAHDFRIFNRALTAAEVADLYETGVVAVADRWGNPTPAEDDMSADNTSDWFAIDSTIAFDTDKYVWTYTTTTQQLHYTASPIQLKANQKVRFSVDIKNGTASNVIVTAFAGNGTSAGLGFQTLGTTSASWTNYTIETTLDGSLNTSYIYPGLFANMTSGNIEIRNFKAEIIGAIADLPLDEGIGYQFHDRSSNHFDALASLTGVTHLVPKANGKVRVKAANASSAMYMLRADSILPENSIVSNVLSEQCYVDLTNSAQTLNDYRIRLNPSGSDLQIQRSDGSNHQTLGTVTAPSSLSDVDVQINYKQIAQ